MGKYNFDAAKDAPVVSPSKLAHIVLRSNNHIEMIEFYKKFLGAKVQMEAPFGSFLAYDDEHHRIAIVTLPGTGPKQPESSGLEHIAFTFNNLPELLYAYRQRKALGIEPVWCVNHGPTMSMYYRDPDGNKIETQVDSFETLEECDAFMRSEAFATNPIGVDFDPEEIISRLQENGTPEELLKRLESGPRAVETIPLLARS